MNVLRVENLRISYRSQHRWQEVVHNVSFSLQRGEMLAFVGESGSGKTTTARAIIGLLANNARRDSGRVEINGEDISGWSGKRLDSLRGTRISLVPQDPGTPEPGTNDRRPGWRNSASAPESARPYASSRYWPC